MPERREGREGKNSEERVESQTSVRVHSRQNEKSEKFNHTIDREECKEFSRIHARARTHKHTGPHEPNTSHAHRYALTHAVCACAKKKKQKTRKKNRFHP